jgi:nitrate reductase gamma subunit
VLRYISTFNDYSSLVVTMLPFITGFLAFAHYGLAYETMLALHILSISLLLVWFPFSKLFHVITLLPSRYILGVKFWRRGVQA